MRPMRSRTSRIVVAMALLVCLVCPVLEMFDHWDHTIQTGQDTEYNLVVLALCVGVGYSFARFIFGFSLSRSGKELVSTLCLESLFFVTWAVLSSSCSFMDWSALRMQLRGSSRREVRVLKIGGSFRHPGQ
jgi:hypothetical protein